MNMSFANIFAGILFGAIGFSAFIYGKKQADIKALIIGVLLMGYSYFIPNTIANYAIGTILTVGLFF